MKRGASGEKEELDPDHVRKRTFERAVKLLAAKPRSIAELRQRLLEGRGTTKAIVELVITRLCEYGYLDDEKYAFSYASLKVKQRPVGRRRLEQDLRFKKIDKKVAADALELVYAETTEDALIDRAIEKRIRVKGRPSDRIEAKKFFDYLLRLGFEYELVSDKLRILILDQTDE